MGLQPKLLHNHKTLFKTALPDMGCSKHRPSSAFSHRVARPAVMSLGAVDSERLDREAAKAVRFPDRTTPPQARHEDGQHCRQTRVPHKPPATLHAILRSH
jgi:hypothetical protein